MVRVKCTVAAVEDTPWKPGAQTITLLPVVDGSPENKAFYAATPGGTLQLCVVRPEVAAQFRIGQAFYVDFTPADEA